MIETIPHIPVAGVQSPAVEFCRSNHLVVVRVDFTFEVPDWWEIIREERQKVMADFFCKLPGFENFLRVKKEFPNGFLSVGRHKIVRHNFDDFSIFSTNKSGVPFPLLKFIKVKLANAITTLARGYTPPYHMDMQP